MVILTSRYGSTVLIAILPTSVVDQRGCVDIGRPSPSKCLCKIESGHGNSLCAVHGLRGELIKRFEDGARIIALAALGANADRHVIKHVQSFTSAKVYCHLARANVTVTIFTFIEFCSHRANMVINRTTPKSVRRHTIPMPRRSQAFPWMTSFLRPPSCRCLSTILPEYTHDFTSSTLNPSCSISSFAWPVSSYWPSATLRRMIEIREAMRVSVFWVQKQSAPML